MLRFFLLLMIIILYPLESFAKKPNRSKHSVYIGNKALRLSSLEGYLTYLITPKFLDECIFSSNINAKEKKERLMQKFKKKENTPNNAGQLKYELKDSKYMVHEKASWEDPNFVVVVISASIKYEPGYLGSIGEEYHLNKGTLTSTLINDKDGNLVCKPTSTEFIENFDFNYIKHVYDGFDSVPLSGSFPDYFPYDTSKPLGVFKYDPKCFLNKDLELVLETTKGIFSKKLKEKTLQEIKKEFNIK